MLQSYITDMRIIVAVAAVGKMSGESIGIGNNKFRDFISRKIDQIELVTDRASRFARKLPIAFQPKILFHAVQQTGKTGSDNRRNSVGHRRTTIVVTHIGIYVT